MYRNINKFLSLCILFKKQDLLLVFLLVFIAGVVKLPAQSVTWAGSSVTQDLSVSQSFPFTLPSGADRLIVVCVGGQVTEVTFNGIALTRGRVEGASYIFYGAEGTSGISTTANVIVSGTNLGSAVATSFTNVDQGSPKGNNNGAETTLDFNYNTISLDVSSSLNNVVCDCINPAKQDLMTPMSLTVGANQTQIAQLTFSNTYTFGTLSVDVNAAIGMSYESGAVPTPNTMSWDFSDNSTYAYVAMEINAVTSIPVELTTFSAAKQAEYIALNWSTASELNNKGFQIERSIDGVTFEKIDFVEGIGTTIIPQEYRYIDIPTLNQVYYYRLKQIDYDGTFEYSKIVVVDARERLVPEIRLEPTMVKSHLNLRMDMPITAALTVAIYAINGQLMKMMVLNDGQNNVMINMSKMPKGMYWVQLNDGQQMITKRVMKL